MIAFPFWKRDWNKSKRKRISYSWNWVLITTEWPITALQTTYWKFSKGWFLHWLVQMAELVNWRATIVEEQNWINTTCFTHASKTIMVANTTFVEYAHFRIAKIPFFLKMGSNWMKSMDTKSHLMPSIHVPEVAGDVICPRLLTEDTANQTSRCSTWWAIPMDWNAELAISTSAWNAFSRRWTCDLWPGL